jgi:YebC/PmpR family DNA-binding regulatory protein
MAGHSKWKNIQHRKNAQDAKKGKVFTKIATEITVAVKIGGGDPESNPRLRAALVKGRGVNMPKDNIERAIKKGLGDLDGQSYSEKTYEGYGAGGVAFVVECLTDNVNRTVGDVRHCFTKFGGSIGTEGSVSWQFHKKGLLVFEKSKFKNPDQLVEKAIENGAEDVKDEDGAIEVTCAVPNFLRLKDAMEKEGHLAEVAEVTRIPENFSAVAPEEAQSIQKMIDWLEDMDDVQNVYHNAALPDV